MPPCTSMKLPLPIESGSKPDKYYAICLSQSSYVGWLNEDCVQKTEDRKRKLSHKERLWGMTYHSSFIVDRRPLRLKVFIINLQDCRRAERLGDQAGGQAHFAKKMERRTPPHWEGWANLHSCNCCLPMDELGPWPNEFSSHGKEIAPNNKVQIMLRFKETRDLTKVIEEKDGHGI